MVLAPAAGELSTMNMKSNITTCTRTLNAAGLVCICVARGSALTLLALAMAIAIAMTTGCRESSSAMRRSTIGNSQLVENVRLHFSAYDDSERYLGRGAWGRGAQSSPAQQEREGLTLSHEQVLALIARLERDATRPAGLFDQTPGVGAGYRYGTGDVVDVAVHARPEFNGRLTVRSDGTIVLPVVGDLVPTAGLRPAELRDAIAGWLHPRYLRQRPRVSVHLVHSRRSAVQVFGAVARPGRYLIGDEQVTVLTAVLAANGADAITMTTGRETVSAARRASPTASEKSADQQAKRAPARSRSLAAGGLKPRLDRVVLITPATGGKTIMDLTQAMAGEHGADRILLPGQIVYVPSEDELKDNSSTGYRLVHGAAADLAAQLATLLKENR